MAAVKVFSLFSLVVSLAVSQRAEFSHYRHDYHIIPHAVDLDTITLDKVISHHNITVVLFMHYLSYGPKQTEFANFAESTLTQPTVLAATVGVIENGDGNNWELAVRYKITMDDVPIVKLFVRGEEVATMKEPIVCDNLRAFVTEQTGVWVGRLGTVEYLEDLAKKFMIAETRQEREKLLDMARDYRDKNPTREELLKSATYYIRVMEQYLKRGHAFLGLEEAMLKQMFARHKLYKPEQRPIRIQQNILKTFINSPYHLPHDEL
ncbi:endoplasmic reticulum resident protein 29-like [Watersipora subatra]|uniref:endoplasmic reticulum resident protein 29-like n=1 Tax=Watersipora subatra TaxID=2589382 RepID=UPI00355AEB9C